MVHPEMQTLYFNAPRKVSIGMQPTPKPGPHEVLVKVHCVGLCGTDLHIYQGDHGRATFPMTPGHEWSGEIIQKGGLVTNFSVGDRVVGETTISCGRCKYCLQGHYNLCPSRAENGIFGKDGAASQYMIFPEHALHRFGSSLSFEQACLIEPSAVAYHAVDLIEVKPSDDLIVIGAGPIGLLSVAIAKIFGAKQITLVDMREHRLEIGRQLGADHIINLTHDDYLDNVRKITKNKLFSTAIEASGSRAAIEQILNVMAPAGRLCFLGSTTATIDFRQIISKELKLYGSLSSPGVWDTVVQLYESGKLCADEIITHRLKIQEFEEALQLMENRDPSIIKAIVHL